jgi:hypothetical protein
VSSYLRMHDLYWRVFTRITTSKVCELNITQAVAWPFCFRTRNLSLDLYSRANSQYKDFSEVFRVSHTYLFVIVFGRCMFQPESYDLYPKFIPRSHYKIMWLSFIQIFENYSLFCILYLDRKQLEDVRLMYALKSVF